jgi:hypothetical protein
VLVLGSCNVSANIAVSIFRVNIMNNGTGRIAADSLDRTVWSWY